MVHVSQRDKIPNSIIRERTAQKELGCIITRKRLTWLGHVARKNIDKRAKQVLTWHLWERRIRPRKNWPKNNRQRPERIGADLGGCIRRGGEQKWMEEMPTVGKSVRWLLLHLYNLPGNSRLKMAVR